MDQETLMLFIRRIVLHSDRTKATLTLGQLETLLRQQGDTASAELVVKAVRSIPELDEAAQKEMLTPHVLAVCERRAREREERERMARMQGRC